MRSIIKKTMKKIINNILNDSIGKSFDTTNLQQRGVADVIEKYICEQITKIDNKELIIERSKTKRSLEDVQIKNNQELYKIDIKTHDLNSDFSMPNLISVDRLKKFYENNNNHLMYIIISYTTNNNITQIKNIEIRYIEELSWEILGIQNLGKGQLQIKNLNNELIFVEPNREEWIKTLKQNMIKFYKKQIIKTQKLIDDLV
jgi:hypothetical protein